MDAWMPRFRACPAPLPWPLTTSKGYGGRYFRNMASVPSCDPSSTTMTRKTSRRVCRPNPSRHRCRRSCRLRVGMMTSSDLLNVPPLSQGRSAKRIAMYSLPEWTPDANRISSPKRRQGSPKDPMVNPVAHTKMLPFCRAVQEAGGPDSCLEVWNLRETEALAALPSPGTAESDPPVLPAPHTPRGGRLAAVVSAHAGSYFHSCPPPTR